MALVFAEGLFQEGLDEFGRLLNAVLAAADGDHVGIVVLAGKTGSVQIPRERGADSLDLVGRDLFAVPGTAEDDAERINSSLLVRDHGQSGADAEPGVIVEGIVDLRSVVHDLIALLPEMADEMSAQLHASVVGGDVDAGLGHGGGSSRLGG